MRSMTGEEWMVASQLYAFLGNSLLSPMSRTESVGLDPAFWRELGGLLGGALADSAESLASWAERASADAARSEVVQRVSVEFTKLFVGPPKPAAAPWESANGPVDSHVGFGEATFAMRERLRALGLELCNENNQYEDHVGIELRTCPSFAAGHRKSPPASPPAMRPRRMRRRSRRLFASIRLPGCRVFARRWRRRSRRAISFACSMLCWRC